MTNSTYTSSAPSPLWQYWRGLSGWNFYFLVKFGLLWAGYLNFHPLLNLVFMAFLLMPIPNPQAAPYTSLGRYPHRFRPVLA